MGIFKAIGNFLKKILDVIRKVLAIILIIIAVILFIWATICTAGATLVVFGFVITQTMAIILGILAVVGAFLIDGKTASKVVGKIGDAASDAAQSVGQAVGNVAGGLISGVADSPLVWLIGGVALFYLLSGNSGSTEKTAVNAASSNEAPKVGTKAGVGKQRNESKEPKVARLGTDTIFNGPNPDFALEA